MLRIPQAYLQKIDWEGIEVAIYKLQDQEKSSKMKIMHDYLPTRCLLSKRNGQNSSLYPNCQKTSENVLHVFQCSHRSATSAYNVAI